MNITVQEIRALGFKKINKIMLEDSHELFRQALSEVAVNLTGFRTPAYSMLDNWSALKSLNDSEVGGLRALMKAVEPLIDEVQAPDQASKRKFRNIWENVWTRYAEACDLDDYTKATLYSVGLNLPIYMSRYVDILRNRSLLEVQLPSTSQRRVITAISDNSVRFMCSFFNMVLGWYYTTMEQSSDSDKLVELLVVSGDEDFKKKFSGGIL